MINKDIEHSLNLLKNRYSCRQFSSRRIEDDVLNEILQVGIRAASGGNLQPVTVIMIRDQSKKDKIRELCWQGFIADADTLLVYLLDYHRLNSWATVQQAPFGKQYSFTDFVISMEDVMCVAQSIECAATLLGVGSVYIGTVNYVYDELKELLNLPPLTIPVVMSCLGYSKSDNEEIHLQGHLRRKLSQEVVVHNESYQPISDETVKEEIVASKYQNWLQKMSGEVLEKYKAELFEVAKDVNGEEYAAEVVKRIEEQQGINRAQFRLGYHYNPVRLREHNKNVLRFYKQQGFDFWSE